MQQRRGRNRRVLLGILSVTLLALVVARLMLPYLVKRKVNETLSKLPDYTGQVDGVHLALWRGAIELQDLTLKHRDEDFSLTIKSASAQLQWPHLFRRLVVADIRVKSPRVRMLVERPAEAVKQTKEKTAEVDKAVKAKTGQSLPDLLAGLIPFRINSFALTDGSFRMREKGENIEAGAAKDEAVKKDSEEGQEKEPGLEARVNDIEIAMHNLTNTRKDTETLMARGEASAKIMDHGNVLLHLRVNPVAEVPTFYLGIEVKQLELIALNPLLRWQLGIDAERGTFELFSESAAENGRFKGYIKPLIRDLKMVNFERDKKSPAKIVKEAIVGAVAAVFKNKEKDQVATKIPFEGKFENPSIGLWEAVLQVLRNAFIEALKPNLDRTIKLKNV